MKIQLCKDSNYCGKIRMDAGGLGMIYYDVSFKPLSISNGAWYDRLFPCNKDFCIHYNIDNDSWGSYNNISKIGLTHIYFLNIEFLHGVI